MARRKGYRKPSQGLLHARQVPELRLKFRVWLAENEDRFSYLGQKLGIESVVNALILHLLEMPAKDRDRMLSGSLARAEELEKVWQAEMRAEVAAGRLVADKDGNLSEPEPPEIIPDHVIKPPRRRNKKNG